MKRVQFCFGVHSHQPIGNFDHVIEEAYKRAYLPFFKLASKYDIKFSSHFSGILLEWLAGNHPEYLTMLREMISSHQLEMIGGGYYEPILAVISDRDKKAQIEKLSHFLKKNLHYSPTGLWLAERVWEQQLVLPLARAGVRFVIVDDTHFKAAGLHDSDLDGYYLTEDSLETVAVFPISKALRYTIPFSSVDETIAILRDAASEKGDRVITFADDAEKFGVWPRTYDHVYKNGWLKEFFAKLNEHRGWIKCVHFSDVIQSIPPKGTIYLPNASYAEMMQWALPSAKENLLYEDFVHKLGDGNWSQYRQFVRGGFWRNFFVKYPESNHLHKRMLDISERYAVAGQTSDALLAAQCNDAYWHGVFGGVYLPNLRHEVYSKLLAAEAALHKHDTQPAVFQRDLNADGVDDVHIVTKNFALTIDPSRGGAISELSFLPKNFNLSNFVNRIPEAYHERLKVADHADTGDSSKSIHDLILTKEDGLEKFLINDWYRHGSFIEHFFGKHTNVHDLEQMTFLEHGDFFLMTINPVIEFDESKGEVTISFEYTGSVFQNAKGNPVRLRKSLVLAHESDVIRCTYQITNSGNDPLRLRFGSEWTFGLLTGDAHDRYYESPNIKFSKKDKQLRSCGELKQISALSLVDEWGGYRIDLESETLADYWRAPIETVASSETGFERVYQGSIVIPVWKFDLKPQEEMSLSLSLRVSVVS